MTRNLNSAIYMQAVICNAPHRRLCRSPFHLVWPQGDNAASLLSLYPIRKNMTWIKWAIYISTVLVLSALYFRPKNISLEADLPGVRFSPAPFVLLVIVTVISQSKNVATIKMGSVQNSY